MPLPEARAIITDSLSPALAISAIGLLIFGLNNRITTIATRVRDLNKELRQHPTPHRRENIRRQIPLFLKRARLIRNSMFLLFGALGMMVFTAATIAVTRVQFVNLDLVPVWSFLGGLFLVLVAVVIESYETIVNLRTLSLDVQNSLEMALNDQQAAHEQEAPVCTPAPDSTTRD